MAGREVSHRAALEQQHTRDETPRFEPALSPAQDSERSLTHHVQHERSFGFER